MTPPKQQQEKRQLEELRASQKKSSNYKYGSYQKGNRDKMGQETYLKITVYKKIQNLVIEVYIQIQEIKRASYERNLKLLTLTKTAIKLSMLKGKKENFDKRKVTHQP